MSVVMSSRAAQQAADWVDGVALEMHRIAKEKGWHDRPRDLPEVLMLMVTELAEAMEAYREGGKDSEKLPGMPAVLEELADCVIRIMDWTASQDLSLGTAIMAKAVHNATRPYRHGGKIA